MLDATGGGDPVITAFISVDYEEFKPETYRAVTVSINDAVKRFEGHFFGAYREAVRYACEHSTRVMELSSVDDFAADLHKAKQ